MPGKRVFGSLDAEVVREREEGLNTVLEAMIPRGQEISGNGQGMQPDPEIEGHIQKPESLNPRALDLVMVAQYYYVHCGEVQKGYGYSHLALFRCKADMNCCAVFDPTIWQYAGELCISINDSAWMAGIQSSAVEELASVHVSKRASTWAVEQEATIAWSYDRRWCLFYNADWMASKNTGWVARAAAPWRK